MKSTGLLRRLLHFPSSPPRISIFNIVISHSLSLSISIILARERKKKQMKKKWKYCCHYRYKAKLKIMCYVPLLKPSRNKRGRHIPSSPHIQKKNTNIIFTSSVTRPRPSWIIISQTSEIVLLINKNNCVNLKKTNH